MNTPLQQAAQAVIARWESPAWKDMPHTGEYIDAMRKALADEQAQALFAGPEKWTSEEIKAGHIGIRWIGKHGVYGRPTQHDVRKYLDARGDDAKCSCDECKAEQAQAVEPVAWTLTETLNKRVTTTSGHLWFSNPVNCCWTPLYLHPAPPPAGEQIDWQDMYLKQKKEKEAMAAKYEKDIGPLARVAPATGERSELIKELRLLKFHVGGSIGDIVNRAADMLEADALEIERMRKMYEQAHQSRANFRQAFREARKAQQVAVPVPMSDSQIDQLWMEVSSEYDKTADGYESHNFARAIEKHHGITNEQK